MKLLTDRDFFFCYTVSMSMYLKEQGFNYVFKAKSVKNGETFTLYQKSTQLQKALEQYEKIKFI